jgi:uncharacterized membrane protein
LSANIYRYRLIRRLSRPRRWASFHLFHVQFKVALLWHQPMRYVSGFLRLLALLFTLILSLFLLGVGALTLGSGETLHFDVVPLLEGDALAQALLAMGILGLTALVLLFRMKVTASWLLFMWNLGVVSVLVCAVTRSSYRFDGMDHFMNGLYLFLLALVALVGSWLQVRAARSAGSQTA